ncbi:prepilin peptidase [Mediterraneibacter agrestimuris]|uniref:prepilin peptidase n=1 Tax=Mediterraneibacter agrestimuris TaxID=2941333 RepID=UPI00203E617C|nr:A24 family peptidase [Mediterraneibacter agrestimuris]
MREIAQIYEISQAGCLLYLGSLSIVDIRSRRLPIWLLAAGGILAVGFQIIWGGVPGILIVLGGTVGLVFLAVSKATGENFGYGDSILIGILGIYLGFWNLLSLLAVTFTFAAGTAMAVLIRHKFRRKTMLPFVPFLGMGYAAVLLLGGF